MKNTFIRLLVLPLILFLGCNRPNPAPPVDHDKTFAAFEARFLDAYWQQYPSGSINAGYGKYYEKLVVPDSTAFANNIAFSKAWMDSLDHLDYERLSGNNKISFNIIKNQLQSDVWYTSVFKLQEWDPSVYNISASCDYILNQPYAPLEARLRILTQYLANADAYYKAALHNLKQPTREHTELAVQQNRGGLEVFGAALSDSINISRLSDPEKAQLRQNVDQTVQAMKGFISGLEVLLVDKNQVFRDFRIGKALFAEKFKYDLATDLTPEQVYAKALADKQFYHLEMYTLADSLWPKYYKAQPKPTDSLQLVQQVLNKIRLNHATPADFFNSINQQVIQLKRFILEKDLFDFDTNAAPIKVRYMPVYARGVSTASADFIPPYQKQGTTYYNIDDLTLYPKDKAESVLQEDNYYASQILSIHEAIPGHCLQGIYNNKKSPDVLRSVFQNGAMIEGWAVYTEGMMVENGWGNHAPEMDMALGTWKLRELANVLIDYDIQCLNKPKADIVRLLSKECFQTDAQVEEKYHRATVSQVQLCSYYTGASAILALRDEYKKKTGAQYSLKGFHEKFLSFGSSPVKYIREQMLE